MQPIPTPPHCVTQLLRWFCPANLLEEIEGDLFQKFERDVNQFGVRKAKRRFTWNVIRYFRPGIVMRNKVTLFNNNMLITNHFRFAWRNLFRHKVFSAINIAGLTLGMAVCMIITNYVLFEKSYDSFHEKGKNIFRVTYSRFIDNKFQFQKAQTFPAVGETLKASVPEVENFTRIFPATTYVEAILSVDGNDQKSYSESSIYAVDSTFLKVFSFPLIRGNANTALIGEKKFIISSTIANKFFGSEDVLGKTIHWEGMGDWTVSGVFKDLPENSHMKFNLITSWMNVYGERSAWNWDGFYTYLLLKPNADLSKTETLIQQVLDEKLNERPDANRVKSTFQLQPLRDIHLTSHLDGEIQANGNQTLVFTLQIIAILILSLALINYYNLSLARIIKRVKEVGVRKINGSSRLQLIGLFFIESFTFNIISFILAVVIFIFSTQAFNNLVEKPVLQMLWLHPDITIPYIGFFILFISLITALYPAKIITAHPIVALKGSNKFASHKGHFRKSLLILQLLTTIVLVSGTILICQQVNFMLSQNPGFNLNQNLVIKTMAGAGAEMDSAFINKLNLFKNKTKDRPEINNITISSNIPGRENDWIGRLMKPDGNNELITTSRTRIDTDFFDTYGIQFAAGRNLSSEISKQVVLNLSAASLLGYSNPQDALGNKLMGDYEIVGVVNDYHERSLQQPIQPAMFTPGQGYMKYITVNIKPGDFGVAVESLKREWKIIYPEKPFEYFFLDDFFNRQYQQEKQLEKVFAYFSGIGLFIACLGLFGFTYYVSHQRIKEIGIRKTLGASASSLLRLLSTEFIILLLIACVIAIPLSYFLSTEWLSHYTTSIQPNPSTVLYAILIVGIMAFISILFLLLKAIRINPSESLKHE
ncbi:MAG: ABC transporter permease [Cyclobacteriaceae bacterium]|nr:ABC transporter permease [Cyclobacteriaceae bacterium]